MASNVYRGLTIEIDGKTDKLTAALSRVNGEVKTANNSLAGLNRALKIDPGNLTLMGDKVKAAGSKVDATKERVDSLTQAQQRLAASGDTDSATYQRLGQDIATSEAYLKRYTEQLGTARVEYAAQESSMGRLGTRLTEVGETLEPIGQRAETIGRALTGTLTVGAVSASVAATNLALSFDTAMSQLAGALGEPVDELGDLRELAIQTGQDTIYSAQESAGAMVELAKGGLTEADIAGGALASTMDLAAAGSLGLSDAANDVVQTMGAFHLGADEVGVAVNALAGGANASSADVGDLTQALSQVSAVAYGAGWSISDTVAALAMFADAGIKGSDAGTSLKSMLSKLEGPSDAAAEAMDAYGISLYEADGSMKSVGEVADNLKEGLSGLSNEERNAALTTIFGSDAVRAANVLYNEGSEGLSKYTDATEDQTSAQTMANAQMGEGQRAIENAKGAIETAGIELGENFAPIVAEAADAVGDAAEQFGNLDSQAQVAVVGVAALAGPVTTVAGKVLKGTKQVGEGLTSAAKFFAKVGGAANVAEEGISASAVAMGVAKTGGIALATIALAAIVTAAIDAKKREDELTEATSGLASAQSNAAAKANAQSTATDTATTSEADLAAAIKNASDETNAAIESQAKMASTIESNFESTDRTNAQLGSYRDTIDQLANKSGLTAQQQADLKTAVDGLNQSCGTAYSVIDAENGKIADQSGIVQEDTKAIDELVRAKQVSNQIDALNSAYEDSYTQEATDAKALTDATSAQAQAQQKYDDALASGMGETEMGRGTLAGYRGELDKANKTLADAQSAYDADTGAMSSYNDQLNLLTQAQSAGADSVAYSISQDQEFIAQVEGSGKSVSSLASQMTSLGVTADQMGAILADPTKTDQLVENYDGSEQSIVGALQGMGLGFDVATGAAQAMVDDVSASIQSMVDSGSADLTDMGLSAGELSQALSDAGVSSQASAAIANGSFAGMLAQSGGDLDALIGLLQSYNNVPILNKDGSVDINDASLTDAQGNVWTWNGTDFVDKDGNASVNDQELVDAQGNVWTWNGTSLNPKGASATVDAGSLNSAQGDLYVWDSSSLDPQSSTATIGAESLRSGQGDLRTWNASSLSPQSGTAVTHTDSVDTGIGKIKSWNAMDFLTKTASAVVNFFTGNAAGGITANAAGGMRLHADGGVRLHARGYIAATAQPLDVVGEDGAEAIIPLTNRHYVTPFARAVAQQMMAVSSEQAQSTRASTPTSITASVDAKALGKIVADEVHSSLSDLGVYVDGKKLVGATASGMNVELARIGARR